MFSVDIFVVEFIQGNFLSVTIFLGLLKGIAKMTPTVYDDKIATLLGRMVGLAKPMEAAKRPIERVE